MENKIQFRIFDLLPEMGVNTYLIWNSEKKAIIIDPSVPSKKLIAFVEKNHLEVILILNTHGHFDHIGGNDYFSDYFEVDIAIHKDDANMLPDPKQNLSAFTGKNIVSKPANIILKDNQIIKFGNENIKVIHTPGHSRGSVSFLIDNYLFSGDTLFSFSIGRTDLPGGNYKTLENSIVNKLFRLNDEIKVYPGHGPETILGDEKVENPYFGIFANR